MCGTWRSDKAEPYRDDATFLGRRLAEAGLDLACGPGTGIARHVVDGYRSVAERGTVRFYLPRAEEMQAVGEVVGEGADEIVQTPYDYPMRNVWQIKRSQAVFVLTGGDGTLEEILPALIDYALPVAIVEGAGDAATAMRLLVGVWPAWQEQVVFGADAPSLVEPFIARVHASASAPAAP